MKLAKTKGLKRALVAVARKLAVIMHAMWKSGADYRWSSTADGGAWSESKRRTLNARFA